MNINMTSAKDLVFDVLSAKLVPFLQSSPGIGKSSLAKEIAKENQLKLIDIRLSQMDPADLQGIPFRNSSSELGDYAEYLPMNIFPLEGQDLEKGSVGWLLLLDEFNSAPMSVQAAAYRLVLDRQVGQKKLHERCLVMGAGNLMTDKAIVNRLSTAMQSRLVHFTIEADYKAWIKWADKNNIDHRVKSFINFKPGAIHKFDPNHQDETFPCPRTWEFISKLIEPYPELPDTKLPLLSGTIGEGMAREFFSFSKVYGEIPNIEDIKRDPKGIHLSTEPSIHYALAGLISHHLSIKNAQELMDFLVRLNIDFQVIALRAAIARDREIRGTPSVKAWISRSAKELM